MSALSPLCPQQRTLAKCGGESVSCHKRLMHRSKNSVYSITSSARPRRGNTYSKSARGHEVYSQCHLGREFQGKIARWYSMPCTRNKLRGENTNASQHHNSSTRKRRHARDIHTRLGAAGVGLAFLENNLALAIMARLREMTNDENPLPSSRISVLQRCNNCRSILYHRS
jgi:hypothetical protein